MRSTAIIVGLLSLGVSLVFWVGLIYGTLWALRHFGVI